MNTYTLETQSLLQRSCIWSRIT